MGKGACHPSLAFLGVFPLPYSALLMIANSRTAVFAVNKSRLASQRASSERVGLALGVGFRGMMIAWPVEMGCRSHGGHLKPQVNYVMRSHSLGAGG